MSRAGTRRLLLGCAAVLAGLTSAACGSGAAAPSPGSTPHGAGAVDVLYAGSLIRLMEQDLGPRFTAESGYRFSGYAGGSKELANEIKGGVQRADVFVSADPSVDATLQGNANGEWVSWYATFARSALVLGYDPHSRFAAALRARPWYDVVTSPGFRLGRTDPALDPKGVLTVEALRQMAQRAADPSLLELANGSSGVYPEATLLGRLEAGQLDAAFLYEVEAKAAGIPTVSLSPLALSATFTVTIVNRAPHPAGALAFVRFLLGSRARQALSRAGLEAIDPSRLHGTGAPASLRSAGILR